MYRKLLIEEMGRLSPDEYRKAEKIPFAVVLDNVRSLHNVGAVFRTADAFRLESLYLCGMTATPPNQEMHKTALGAELVVDWQYFKETTETVAQLQQSGYKVFAIEQAENSISLQEFIRSEIKITDNKIAIVLGHEVFGVQQEVIDLSDGCIEIPQYGTKHSLNVSVTAGIVMYEIASHFRHQSKIC